MAPSHPEPKPKFFWQGILILLPVIVLVVVSLVSLKQDERTAEQDARNRAAENVKGLAAALRPAVETELHRFVALQNEWTSGLRLAGQPVVNTAFPDTGLSARITQWERDYPQFKLADLAAPSAEILTDGRRIEPPDFPPVPTPPKWFRELSLEQKALWEALRFASPAQMETRRQAFMDSQPSELARQAASYQVRPPEQLIGHSNFLDTEAGVSFEAIACYQLLSVTNARLTDELLQSVWWRAINENSFLSPRLLTLAEGLTNRAGPVLSEKFFRLQQFQIARSQTMADLDSLRVLPELRPWKVLWWSHWTGDGSTLALFQPITFVNSGADVEGMSLSGQGYEIQLVPHGVMEAIFKQALMENKFFIPAYARVAVVVAGEPLPVFGRLSNDDGNSLLGRAGQKAGNGYAQDAIPFEVTFYLASREQMLAGERHRERLFAVLTLGALLAAMAGCLAAWRAWRRQLQLNELKSNFVSSVSHELRAPIASMRLMAENLDRGKISDAQKQGEYFRFIVQECRRLSSLVENILDFSRIEQNRKQYDFEPTDLVALVRQTVKLMEPYAAEKNVTLEIASLPVSAELNADGHALQQALVNLIDNAVKHSPKGQTVTLGMEIKSEKLKMQNERRPEASDLLPAAFHLYVLDHGSGIPAGEHAKIFERFYRRGSELRRETPGVGIGLSIVKHIVEAHGGRVSVQSAPGEGSRFTIELPVIKNHE